MHETYDLKGSTVNRWASEQEKASSSCVLKDLDFTHELHVSPSDHALIGEQLEADSAFLRRQGVVDYSLLCMLHYKDRQPLEPRLAQLAPGATRTHGEADDARKRSDDERDDEPQGDGDEGDSESVAGFSEGASWCTSHSGGTSQSAASTVLRDAVRDSRVASASFRQQERGVDASILKALHTAGDVPSDGSPAEPLQGINGMLEATTAKGERPPCNRRELRTPPP